MTVSPRASLSVFGHGYSVPAADSDIRQQLRRLHYQPFSKQTRAISTDKVTVAHDVQIFVNIPVVAYEILQRLMIAVGPKSASRVFNNACITIRKQVLTRTPSILALMARRKDLTIQ